MMSGLELIVGGLVAVFVAYKIVNRYLPQGGEDLDDVKKNATVKPKSSDVDLSGLTKKQLIEVAQKKGLTTSTRMTKSNLIDLIKES